MSRLCKGKDPCEVSCSSWRPARPDRHDPVEGSRVQQLVVEGVVPLRVIQIAGDDCRPPIVAIRDDVMEVFVLSGAHGLEAEVVDDEQIRLGQRRQLALVSVHGPIRGELAQVSTKFEN